MIYLDSSALVKWIVREAESEALLAFLAKRVEPVSSALAWLEVTRTLRRTTTTPEERARAEAVLAAVSRMPVTDAVLDLAMRIPPPNLRTLDAIHIATALTAGPGLEMIVTYDERLAAAAAANGIDVLAPA
ncbi:MAG TPA: type II toxin-antitoxin system VapC family toxin [Thermoanaerobaculia bacterium]